MNYFDNDIWNQPFMYGNGKKKKKIMPRKEKPMESAFGLGFSCGNMGLPNEFPKFHRCDCLCHFMSGSSREECVQCSCVLNSGSDPNERNYRE